MRFPLALIVGQAGSGKDTAANFLVEDGGAVAIALADPLKALAGALFGFTEAQLWGPSESRNELDKRFATSQAWYDVLHNTEASVEVKTCIQRFAPYISNMSSVSGKLYNWAQALKKTHGDKITPRVVLQELGTELIRKEFGADVWINCGIDVASKLLTGEYVYDRLLGPIAQKTVQPSLVVISDGRFLNEILAVSKINGWTFKIESPQVDGSSTETAGLKNHSSEHEQQQIPFTRYDCIIVNDKTRGISLLKQKMSYIWGIMSPLPTWI